MNEHESAQPCGCDAGANHKCEYHARMAFQMAQEIAEIRRSLEPPREAEESITAADEPYAFAHATRTTLPTEPAARRKYPIFSGVLQYFPDAIAEVANVSYIGNEQHNPGEPLHWDRSKSMDQHNTLTRHLMDAGKRDTDGTRHSAKVAWRALAALQLEIEAEKEKAA